MIRSLTAHDADRILSEWADRGYAHCSDVGTKTTRLIRLTCPGCGRGVRLLPAGQKCAAGCGWEHWRRQE